MSNLISSVVLFRSFLVKDFLYLFSGVETSYDEWNLIGEEKHPEIDNFNHKPVVTCRLCKTTCFSIWTHVHLMGNYKTSETINCIDHGEVPNFHKAHTNADNHQKNSCTNPFNNVENAKKVDRLIKDSTCSIALNERAVLAHANIVP